MSANTDIKSTKAYNILTNLHDDNTIDDEAFTKFSKKIEKIQECNINYMEYEKLLSKRFDSN